MVSPRPEHDGELIQRNEQLDALRKAEREALTIVEAQQQTALNSSQAERRAQERLCQVFPCVRHGGAVVRGYF